MSILRAALPVKDGVAVLKVLTEAASSAKAAGDPRTKGQIMADTLTASACGLESPDDIPVEIQLLMTDMTLLADEEATAWIEGHPLPGRVARDLALGVPTLPPPAHVAADAPAPPPEISSAARWIRRLYADAKVGDLTEVDGRRRLFRGQVRRFILLRDQRCRTPWCDAPIHDIDHAHRFADGGSTDRTTARPLPALQPARDAGMGVDGRPGSDDRPHRLTSDPTKTTVHLPLLRHLLTGRRAALRSSRTSPSTTATPRAPLIGEHDRRGRR